MPPGAKVGRGQGHYLTIRGENCPKEKCHAPAGGAGDVAFGRRGGGGALAYWAARARSR